jgi:hypothetical protein
MAVIRTAEASVLRSMEHDLDQTAGRGLDRPGTPQVYPIDGPKTF